MARPAKRVPRPITSTPSGGGTFRFPMEKRQYGQYDPNKFWIPETPKTTPVTRKKK